MDVLGINKELLCAASSKLPSRLASRKVAWPLSCSSWFQPARPPGYKGQPCPASKLSLPQPLPAISIPSGFGLAHRMQGTDCYRSVQYLSKPLGIRSFTYLGDSLLTPIVLWGKSSLAPIFLIPEHSGHLIRESSFLRLRTLAPELQGPESSVGAAQ